MGGLPRHLECELVLRTHLGKCVVDGSDRFLQDLVALQASLHTCEPPAFDKIVNVVSMA